MFAAHRLPSDKFFLEQIRVRWAAFPFAHENQQKRVEESPVSDSVMLVCAVLASLAAGVLVAYGACLAMFGLFRTHARQVPVKSVVRVSQSASVVEG